MCLVIVIDMEPKKILLRSRTSFWVLVCLSILCNSCQFKRAFVDPKYNNWESKRPSAAQDIKHTVLLVGDVGKKGLAANEPTLNLIQQELSSLDEHSSIVFLGNNIVPHGMPAKDHPRRAQAEEMIDAQLDIVKNFAGKTYFIAGNKDWNDAKAGGREAVLRQEEYIEQVLEDKDAFQPGEACGDPGVVELEKDLTLVCLDSQWFLQDWSKETDMNKGCKVDTRYELRDKLAEIFDEYDDGDFIIAFHHPLMSGGPHGGYASFSDHVFPLTALNPGLFIPLPGIGSIYPALKNAGAFPQDIPHADYQKFIDLVSDLTFDIGHAVFASGHEHLLQFHSDQAGFRVVNVVKSDRYYIGSGSASQTSFLRANSDADFGVAKKGFSKILYYENGEVWIEMWHPINDGNEGELLFRNKIKDADQAKMETAVDSKAIEEIVQQDSTVAVADDIYSAGKTKRKLLGKLYRDAWTAPIKFPVANLEELHGGLTPIKKGGGIQTKSLRLVNPQGKEYVMRSVKKDISLLIPDFAKNTVVQEIAQDELSMSHPYGAAVIPTLAEAAGVFHTVPTFYYVPKQVALGEYINDFGDQVYLIEERPEEPKEGNASPYFGGGKEIISTRALLRNLKESNDNKVDQKAVLRARILDLWLGDWDRHDDQWRWAEFKEDGKDVYRPIPRDRDQVFLSVDGFIPYLLTREWGARMFQDFDYDIRDIQGLAFNARFFDRTFLNEQNEEDWKEMANDMKTSLTDDIIEDAIQRWPDTLFNLNGAEIIDKLKVRRDKLDEFATRYYTYLAREVDVVGSEDRELFRVTRVNDSDTRVEVIHLNKKGEEKRNIYDRVFHRSETKEVRLYGLKGDDQFNVQGEAKKGILIRIIGGLDDDEVVDKSRVGGGKRTIVYDTKEGNTFDFGTEAKDNTDEDASVNIYDRKAFKLNSYLPLAYPGFNRDDGITLGGGITWTRQGFRKEPYKSKQQISATFAVATRAFQASYTGDFIGVLGKYDFHIDGLTNAPFFVYNFFGLGNETVYTQEFDDEFDINRVRFNGVRIYPGFKRTFNNQTHLLKLGPIYELTEIEDTEGRFVTREESGLGPEDFTVKHYTGLRFFYHLDTRDNSLVTTRGFQFKVNTGWYVNAEDMDRNFFQFKTEASIYHYIKSPLKMIFASRAGYATNQGEYEFFQANTLGGRSNLRGFRGERFAGDDAFFHNTELRIPLYQSKNYFLPLRLGIIGFFDYGRVWLEGENSDQFHTGYGGGILIAPYSTVAVNLLYARSEEFNNIIFRLGFFF